MGNLDYGIMILIIKNIYKGLLNCNSFFYNDDDDNIIVFTSFKGVRNNIFVFNI